MMSAPAPPDGSPSPPIDGQRPHLYVGNLSPRVTDQMLQEIFSVTGPVQGVKIVPDRHLTHGGLNYGFVEYHDLPSAENALTTLNGRIIFDSEIKVNWAKHSQPIQAGKEDTMGHYHVFIGDLAPEINDVALRQAFSGFASLAEARVMWDMNSGKSRGYGFASFKERGDAEQSIATMNGEWLGSRTIRVNWANQKMQNRGMAQVMRMPIPTHNFTAAVAPMSYDQILAMAPPNVTTIYCGNLAPYATQSDLLTVLAPFGYIIEVRMQSERGYAFVKLDSHEHAANAIASLAMGACNIHGRPLKVSWGKERENSATAAAVGMRSIQQQPFGGNMMFGVQAPVASSYGYTSFTFPTPTVHAPQP